MRILFTNDDGYDSNGLHAVANLFKDGNEIAVVAPDYQKSGASHSLTLKPSCISCKKLDGYGYDVYAVGGTPVDCVKVARAKLFPDPEIVISGINKGKNLGSDIMYSGTVSAAADAAHLGYRSIALSLDNYDATEDDFIECAKFFKKNFDTISSIDLPKRTILNINFPSVKPIGIKITRMNTQDTFVDIYKSIDSDTIVPDGYRDYSKLEADNDEYYCRNGYITITPLLIDRTDYKALETLKEGAFKL